METLAGATLVTVGVITAVVGNTLVTVEVVVNVVSKVFPLFVTVLVTGEVVSKIVVD